ncbi:MAG: C40 family peptidase [Bacteroidetes bacterium]|nr:C40 family peptidase [Bacteroidota bacterium]
MTNYGICELSLVPVRKQPSEQSEMINQLIFGDTIIIEDNEKQWYLIKTVHDMYEGWIDKKQIKIISESEFKSLSNEVSFYLSDVYGIARNNSGKSINLVLGTRLPNYRDNSISISGINYNIECNTIDNSRPVNSDIIVETAIQYLGAPYLWGGRSPFGIDCSGFVQVVFGMFGIHLKRDAHLQAESGTTINFINETLPGDIAFFDNSEGRITHVGIIIGDKQIIHASGEVRIDRIDHQGIYNEIDKKYTHNLRIIKRLL